MTDATEHPRHHEPHEHGTAGDHDHHDHDHPSGVFGLLARLRNLLVGHSHDSAAKVDTELEASRAGMRTLGISFGVLFATTLLQAMVVAFSGSVALLGDTLHNFADALTAVPLAIAFSLGRRAATRRFTYGYGRAEDLAGLAVVALIAASSAFAGYEAIHRLVHTQTLSHLPWVAAAAVIGFAGNELVARYRIKTGRRIGSAALVADGLHARTDGFTSLAVLIGAAGVWAGWQQADPIVGLVITVAIASVLRQAAAEVFGRMMDAVDPELVATVEATLRATPGVVGVGQLRLRWIGHSLRAECEVLVDQHLSLLEAHAVAHDAEHRLMHDVRRLTAATVHADPQPSGELTHHEALAHHQR